MHETQKSYNLRILDDFRCPLSYCVKCGRQVAADLDGQHRGVDDPNIRGTVYLKLRVDNTPKLAGHHRSRPDGMMIRRNYSAVSFTFPTLTAR